ncbi:MAG: alpha/beta hydrolase [Lachnospiraceae bacterium]|nr:alpha/beta hydrolase [Lachnospiraceae bacterium]
MEIIKDIIYNEEVPGMCRLDVYKPDEVKNAYLYIHGGGNTHGDKCTERTEPLFKDLCENGTFVISVNYRFMKVTDHDIAPRKGDDPAPGENDIDYPVFIEDCAKAVNWAFTSGKKYGDFKKLYIGGSSAGGYITMMLHLNPSYLRAYGLDSQKDIAGYIYDAGQPTTHFHMLELEGEYPHRVLIDERAPMWYLKKPFEDTEYLPEVKFFVAEDDMLNRVKQNELMKEIMLNFGYPKEKITFHQMMGYRHCKYLNDPEYIRLTREFVG